MAATGATVSEAAMKFTSAETILSKAQRFGVPLNGSRGTIVLTETAPSERLRAARALVSGRAIGLKATEK